MRERKDEEIVKLSVEDPTQYKYLVEKYERRLLSYVKRIIYVNTEDAEDILQEVFLKAYRNLNGFNTNKKFSSWIYRIAHNEAISFFRKNSKRNVEIVNDLSKDLFDSISSGLDLEREYIEEEERKRFEKIIQSLDRKYRDVLILKFLEEKDYNEISEILEISSGTVGSLISRAKVKLKVLMEENGKSK